MQYEINIFENQYKIEPMKTFKGSFDECCDFLQANTYIAPTTSIQDVIAAKKTDKDIKNKLPLFSFASFKPDTQGIMGKRAENMNIRYAVELDIDDGCSVEAFETLIREKGLRCEIYTTTSHKLQDETEKFRAIIPLSEPISHKEFMEQYSGSVSAAFPMIDTSTLNKSRLFYVPAYTMGRPGFKGKEGMPGTIQYFYRNNIPGENLNLSSLEYFPPQTNSKSRRRTPNTVVNDPNIDDLAKNIVKQYMALKEEETVVISGEKKSRNEYFFIVCQELARSGISKETAYQYAAYANVDGARNTVDTTVDNAYELTKEMKLSVFNSLMSPDPTEIILPTGFLEKKHVDNLMEEHNRFMIMSPTGTGKSSVWSRYERILFIAPNETNCYQIAAKFGCPYIHSNKVEIDGKVITASPEKQLEYCGGSITTTVASAPRLIKELKDTHIVVWDEYHKVLTDRYRRHDMEMCLLAISDAPKAVLMTGTFEPELYPELLTGFHYQAFNVSAQRRTVHMYYDKVHSKQHESVNDIITRQALQAKSEDKQILIFRQGHRANVATGDTLTKDYGISVKCLNKDTKTGEEFANLYKDGICDADVVLSTSIGIDGLDFNDIHKVILIGNTYRLNEVVQAFSRLRNIQPDSGYIMYFPESGDEIAHYPDYQEVIAEQIAIEDSFSNSMFSKEDMKQLVLQGMSISDYYRTENNRLIRNYLTPFMTNYEDITRATYSQKSKESFTKYLSQYGFDLEVIGDDSITANDATTEEYMRRYAELTAQDKELELLSLYEIIEMKFDREIKLHDNGRIDTSKHTVAHVGAYKTLEPLFNEGLSKETMIMIVENNDVNDAREYHAMKHIPYIQKLLSSVEVGEAYSAKVLDMIHTEIMAGGDNKIIESLEAATQTVKAQKAKVSKYIKVLCETEERRELKNENDYAAGYKKSRSRIVKTLIVSKEPYYANTTERATEWM